MGKIPKGAKPADLPVERAAKFEPAVNLKTRLPALAAELVRTSDPIVAESTRAAHAAKAASPTIPIAAVVNSDPVASGLAAGIARPGGNVTGVAMLAGELAEKRLELLPGARRMAALVRPPGTEFQAALEHTGRSLGVTVEVIRVDNPRELQQALASSALDRFDGVVVPPQSLFLAHRAEIVAALAAKRRPAIYPDRAFVEDGGLMSYGPSAAEAFRRLASHVDRILKGAKPADLPIEQPMRFEVVVNLKTAQALGITLPPAILLRADEAIE
ncbi:MAG: ABC transporter substrate binding protein [Hyphomicrobiaceae bacterium]